MSKNNSDARVHGVNPSSLPEKGVFSLILSSVSLSRLMNKLLNRSDARDDTKGDLPCCSSSHLNANHCRKAARTLCYSDRWTVRVNLRKQSRLVYILYKAQLILCANRLWWRCASKSQRYDVYQLGKPLSRLSRCHGH